MIQAEAVDQLQLENRELRGVQERLGRKERRARDLKKKNANLGEKHTALLEDYEACQEQARVLLCCDPRCMCVLYVNAFRYSAL